MIVSMVWISLEHQSTDKSSDLIIGACVSMLCPVLQLRGR